MAINYLTKYNLNHGNNGTFEGDVSTWVMGDNVFRDVDRANDPYEGIFACRFTVPTGSSWDGFVPASIRTLQSFRAFVQIGGPTKIIVFAYVKNDAVSPLLKDTATIRLRVTTPMDVEVVESEITATGDEIDDYTRLEVKIDLPTASAGFNPFLDFALEFLGDGEDPINYDGSLLVDTIEVWEFAEEPDTCTLAIDLDNTTVNHATEGNNDGSISVAITGAAGTVEYRLEYDTGAFIGWQASPLFQNLFGGKAYLVRVREVATPGCLDEETIWLNEDPATIEFDFTLDIEDESVAGAEDGEITVVVNPTVGAPFDYSIDNGENWQSTNVFSNLAPASYTILVRDDNDSILSKIGVVGAGVFNYNKAYLSKNPILFTRSETANAGEDNYRINIQVEAELVQGSGTFTKLLDVSHEPDADGNTTFNVRQAFRGVMDPQPPDQNENTIEVLTDRSILARNIYGDLYDQLTVPVGTVQGSPYLVVLGGFEKKDYPEVSSFANWVHVTSATAKFLSWAPLIREMDKNQEDYISFFLTNDFSGCFVRTTIYYDDGTSTENHTLFPVVVYGKGRIIRMPIGPVNSGVLAVDPAKTVTKYTIQVINDGTDQGSQIITVNISQVKPKKTRYFLFLNSLGSYEVLRTTGKGEKIAEVSKEIVQKYLPPAHTSDYGEKEVHEVNNERVSSRSSGYFDEKDALNWLQDFAVSKKVYDITNGSRVPVIIRNTQISVDKDDDYRYFMRFEVEEVYANSVFSNV